MRAKVACAALAAVLSSCQTYDGDESSPYYVVPAGSRLTLQQELTIPADELSVFIQNGRTARRGEVQQYYPFCRLYLYQKSASERTVRPGEITITRAMQQRRLTGPFSDAGGLLLARLTLAQDDTGDDNGGELQSFMTLMELRSEKQPELFRLTCAQWAYQGDIGDRHLTITEIRRTLNPLFMLRLPQGS